MKLIIRLLIFLTSIIFLDITFGFNKSSDDFQEVCETLRLASERINNLKIEVSDLQTKVKSLLIIRSKDIDKQQQMLLDKHKLIEEFKWLFQEYRILKKKRRLDKLGFWIKTGVSHIHANLESEISYRFTNWIQVYTEMDFRHEFISKILEVNYELGMRFDIF